MPNNTHLELISADEQQLPRPQPETKQEDDALRERALALTRTLSWTPGVPSSNWFPDQCRQLVRSISPLLKAAEDAHPGRQVSDDMRTLQDNLRLISGELESTYDVRRRIRKVPHVRTPGGEIIPRVAAIACDFLEHTGYQFTEEQFTSYLSTFQTVIVLNMRELWDLVSTLKLVLLKQIGVRGMVVLQNPGECHGVATCIRSLRDVGQTPWKQVLDPLTPVNQILAQDPAGAYSLMDYESRDLYRERIAKIAAHSDLSEVQVAREVVALARLAAAQPDLDRHIKSRQSHVGYYLLSEGISELWARTQYRPPLMVRVRSFLRAHPNDFYLPAIELLTLAIILAVVWPLVAPYTQLHLVVLAVLVLLIPVSQSAVQVINYLVTSLLQPRILPKLDFSSGIPADCLTLVAVPALLLNETQVRRLVDDVEIRYLGNHDTNLHFALVTDLPDSREQPSEASPLVDLCSELIRSLNDKYASRGMGSFFLFHRHRVYNPRERAWMGWERKRGKLLDLNRILRRQYDSFPVKVGDLSILPDVRFVITLDADTELPRDSAHRMVGTLAHPLNRPIIDQERNIVVAGYGILQPRVGVSVQSAGQSRLASIFSGETGLDIYSRAVSDVYQDLYDEGSFTGKGIYDVDAVHQVLNDRFPRNALLSHDLIEGAYARAGLASDIEVIEDYPSHYSAYNRRKHRWLRGDWQITGWLLPRVTDEQGRKVQNPISLLSQWKILDNLRRSLFEPATFLLLILGWFVLPATPLYWTLVVIGILFVPAFCSLLFGLVRALLEWKRNLAREALNGLFTAYVNVFLTLTFLAHQTLLSMDAVVRTAVRRYFTGQRLLQWETAAEAELGRQRRTPVDVYLDWVPFLAFGLAILVLFLHPQATAAAIPILFLWACSKWIAVWLNRPPYASRVQISAKDHALLHKTALRTWRYFAEFSTPEHNWLIPDNVQQDPLVVAPRVSPTNLGLLLNARQVACEFGYLTLLEFTDQTLKTFSACSQLKRHSGHLLNWYDTRTLEPLPPYFVSSVDNGNLVASLWTLQHGSLVQLKQPLLRDSLRSALLDHLAVLFELHALPRRELARLRKCLGDAGWLNCALELSRTDVGSLLSFQKVAPENLEQAHWFAREFTVRLQNIAHIVSTCIPWKSSDFAAVCRDMQLAVPAQDTPLLQLPAAVQQLLSQCAPHTPTNGAGKSGTPIHLFVKALERAHQELKRLIADVRAVALSAAHFADEMDFRLLQNPHRRMLSAGLDADSDKLHSACYDFLASESRTATFISVAKDDLPQESWFLLSRTHSMAQGRPVLLSWTGTMFEYLMPSIWIRSYPNTMLNRATRSAVRVQQAYASEKGVPWGISESAYSATDALGNYQYHAFGVPQLALRKRELDSLVISPYSTFLALSVDPTAALQNIRKLLGLGALGPYGFYESVDFTPAQRRRRQRFALVRCWMAHHQGMILLSLANFLRDGIVQEWFHADHRVQATELLLHEKPVTYVPRHKLTRKRAA